MAITFMACLTVTVMSRWYHCNGIGKSNGNDDGHSNGGGRTQSHGHGHDQGYTHGHAK